MNRRGFIKRMLGVVTFVVATEVGMGTVAKELTLEPVVKSSTPRGLAYLVANSGVYFDISRTEYGESSNT